VNPPKCSDDDYINFVIATPRSVSATEAAKVQSDEEQAPAHDAFTRLLHRLEPDA
jgi:putative transposase